MIFCVEDDSNIRELVVYTLETTGFQARGFEEGKSFLEALALETPDLILMDIMLPGEDGISLLKTLEKLFQNKRYTGNYGHCERCGVRQSKRAGSWSR